MSRMNFTNKNSRKPTDLPSRLHGATNEQEYPAKIRRPSNHIVGGEYTI